ncbi:MAG: EAL domain-containing response regulator [Pseudomonadota bacterium]|nr:EAL domain-containing response regulator [Pseudomonadota bacterium]
MKILIVDDEPFALKLVVRQLATKGFTDVVPCQRALDALAVLAADGDAIELVICDLQMPDMDGVQLVRHLAEIAYGGSLVLISGEDGRILETAARLARAHQLQLIGALHKPVTADQFTRVLERHRSRMPPIRTARPKVYGRDELHRGIAAGELVNHYQPKVHVASGAVLGVESLVRWQHPQDGLVLPDQFVDTAEQHGLIDALTSSVLTAALRQARVWRDDGLDLDMAVNVSMDNLANLQFPELVAGVAQAEGVPLTQLVIEVTESRLMPDARAPLDILTRLRLKRVQLSVDDFGTGHSSLAQLRDFPFDELKIDRTFVHGACRDPSLRAIFDASRRMARDLGMKVVAEGVEDRADWDLLRATDCDMAQGNFIAAPMPASEFDRWVASWDGQRKGLFSY